MIDYALNLENGQKLRVLPFNKEHLFVSYKFFYLSDYKKSFLLDTNSPIIFNNSSSINFSLRNFYLVEYLNKFHIIKTGVKLNNIIDNYFPSNFTINDKIKHLLNNSIILEPIITKSGPYNNYDKSRVYVNYDGNNMEGLFNTQDYKDIISTFDKYVNSHRLENQTSIIKYLDKNNIFKDNYNYLLRNIKINDIRMRKVNTTKLKLWNKIGRIFSDINLNNDDFDDIGYHKVDEKGDEVHQFMIDGYLFEVKLKDKI